MHWHISDGTIVHLGGEVEGDSSFAETLRDESAEAQSGTGPAVFMHAEPCDGEPLDVDNPRHVDQWVRIAANCLDVAITFAPELPPAPETMPERSEPVDPTLVY